MKAVGLASLAAVLIQPFVFVLRLLPEFWGARLPNMNEVEFFLFAIVLVSLAHVLILGIPLFLLLRRFGRANWTTLSIGGFVAGFIPSAVVGWPRFLKGYSSGGNWHGRHVEFYLDGVPTNYAWLAYLQDTFQFGIHGLVGGLVFFLVWKKMNQSNSALQPPT